MRATLMFLIAIAFIFLESCSKQGKREWKEHQQDFKDVVALLKANKLQKVYGRAGYAIPDTISLQATCGQIVFRETDFTYDNSYSILFHLGFDSTFAARSYQSIVYTNNEKRLRQYESKSNIVYKLEPNWYYIKRY